jgi:serine/threonine protein kinase
MSTSKTTSTSSTSSSGLTSLAASANSSITFSMPSLPKDTFEPLPLDFEKKRKHWKELKDVGRGCFGEIKLIEDPSTGKRYVKKLIPGLLTDEKIKNEISCMNRLKHKNIITLYDAYQLDELIKDKPHVILILEFAESGDLLEYIKRRHRLSETEGRSIFRDILDALDFTHREFILHRDIKAENVFLDSNLRPKIGDWGFAGPWHPEETLDIFCGSLHYSAPEICSGVNYIGPEVDVWSLGVLLYAMICGALPFSGETEWQIFEKIRVANFRLPPFISASAADLLLRMLQVDPKKRITIPEIKKHTWVLGSSLAPVLGTSGRPIQTLSAPTLIGDQHIRKNVQNTGNAPPQPGHYNLNNIGKKLKERFFSSSKTRKPSLPPILEDQVEENTLSPIVSPPDTPHTESVHFEDEEDPHEAPLSPQRALSRGLDKECRRKFSLGRLFVKLHGVNNNGPASPDKNAKTPTSNTTTTTTTSTTPKHLEHNPGVQPSGSRSRAESEGKSTLSKLKRLSTQFSN